MKETEWVFIPGQYYLGEKWNRDWIISVKDRKNARIRRAMKEIHISHQFWNFIKCGDIHPILSFGSVTIELLIKNQETVRLSKMDGNKVVGLSGKERIMRRVADIIHQEVPRWCRYLENDYTSVCERDEEE